MAVTRWSSDRDATGRPSEGRRRDGSPRFGIAFVCVLAAVLWANAAGSDPLFCRENAIIVFDASGSMRSSHKGHRKFDLAKAALAEILPEMTQQRPTGLVTYSGGPASVCSDIALRVRPQLNSAEAITRALSQMQPSGPTPLRDAVDLAIAELRRLARSGILVVVSDGRESCMADVCQRARDLAASKENVQIHTIGFGLRGRFGEELACLAQATGGTFTVTDHVEVLREALRKALACNRIARVSRASDS